MYKLQKYQSNKMIKNAKEGYAHSTSKQYITTVLKYR